MCFRVYNIPIYFAFHVYESTNICFRHKIFPLKVPWNRDILEVFTKRKVAVCCIVGIAFGVVLVGLAIAKFYHYRRVI